MIYFIRNRRDKTIKIGVSNDPMRRLKALQTAHADELELLGVIQGEKAGEGNLHRCFHAFRKRGEWFRGDPKFVAAVKKLIESPEHPNLWHESRRRRGCRNGLEGLTVRRIDTGKPAEIRMTSWSRDRRLILDLRDGTEIDSEFCLLISKWRVTCCRPGKMPASRGANSAWP